MLTRAQLVLFVSKSRRGFENGAMFYAAAEEAGFEPHQLGKPRKFTIHGEVGHHWRPKTGQGFANLVEFEGKVFLEGVMNRETLKMFDLLKAKAVYAAAPPARSLKWRLRWPEWWRGGLLSSFPRHAPESQSSDK